MHATYQKPGCALLLLGHGSSVNRGSSAPTLLHAEEIRRRGIFDEVVCGFWKEQPGFRQTLDTVESREVYIVPNFISEGYFTRKVIPRELGLTGPVTHLPPRDGLPARTLKYCEPVGNHPGMTEILLSRAREIAPGVDPRHAALVIVGHGTPLDENSGLAVKAQAARIEACGQYAEVIGMFLEEEPLVSAWPERTFSADVIVVPFFVSDGLHSYQQIPELLGIGQQHAKADDDGKLFRRNPFRIGGRRLYYSNAIGTGRQFADIILDQIRRFDS